MLLSGTSTFASLKFKGVGTIKSQWCFWHNLNPFSGIKNCTSTIVFSPDKNEFLKEEVSLEITHFKGAYPEGFVGGELIDLNEGDTYESLLCSKGSTFDRCLAGPPVGCEGLVCLKIFANSKIRKNI